MTSDYTYLERFLGEITAIAARLDRSVIDQLALRLAEVREQHGRVFVVGIGGSGANAAHAVCDLRGLAGIEAYAPTDSPAAFTAYANDYGWTESLSRWLTGSRIGPRDLLLVLSVGGGSQDPPVSTNIVTAIQVATEAGCIVCGLVGPDGGLTARLADLCVRVPVADRSFRTTHTEIFQSVIWHLLVTHPRLATVTPKWESITE